MICEYCENATDCNQVCDQCGEPLVDNPEVFNGECFADDCDCGVAVEDDGQPTMYEELQDLYGGDDWDHGQFDECEW